MEINIADVVFALMAYSVVASIWILGECLTGGFVRVDLRYKDVFRSGLLWPLELSYLTGYVLRAIINRFFKE